MYLLAFSVAALLLAMVPGVSTAVILRQTIRAGRKAGMAAIAGNETGTTFWALAAALGLSALVTASEIAYESLRIVGAVVLIVMGIQSIWQAGRRRKGEAEEPEPAPGSRRPGPPGLRRSYGLGLATSLANPKAAVFAVSFLPQFVPAGANVPLTLMLLAAIWAVIDTIWYISVIYLVQRVKAVFARPAVRRRLEQVTGVVLLGLGVRLVTDS